MRDSRPYIFLDRDDTLIIDKEYLRDPAGLEFTPQAFLALRRLRAAGFGLIIVTNQAGIGRGLLTEEDLTAVHARMLELLQQEDVQLDAIYHCPHHPDDGCACRKPATGMILQACKDFAVDLKKSFMIGDSDADIGLGKAMDITTIQIKLFPEQQDHQADYLATNLNQAADWVLQQQKV